MTMHTYIRTLESETNPIVLASFTSFIVQFVYVIEHRVGVGDGGHSPPHELTNIGKCMRYLAELQGFIYTV